MPQEFEMEEDTLQGHRRWTESNQVLVFSPLCGYYVDTTWIPLGMGDGKVLGI